jgi:hypothetical protein
MPEKYPEKPIIPPAESGEIGAAEFLEETHTNSVRENARRFFPGRPDSKLADQTEKILTFPNKAPAEPSIDAVPANSDPEVEMLHRRLEGAKDDRERINLLMGEARKGTHPSDIMEALGNMDKAA